MIFDQIKGPIFLKEGKEEENSIKKQLANLQALLTECPDNIKPLIEEEIRTLNSGIYGEEQISYELKNSHIPMIVLNDLFIEYKELTAQIDYYVITRYCNIIIECKNLIGDIEITNNGDFIRTIKYGNQKHRECIYSPVTQSERHLSLLKLIYKDEEKIQ